MSLNVPIEDHSVSLRDAIAYEFYMDNLSAYMESWQDEDEETRGDIGVVLAKLATAAYTVAEVFCMTRNDILDAQSIESNNDTDA